MSSNTSPKLHSINLNVLKLEITRKMFFEYNAFQKSTKRHPEWVILTTKEQCKECENTPCEVCGMELKTLATALRNKQTNKKDKGNTG